MPQNRKKLIKLIIGSIANAVVHEILRKASQHTERASYYGKEIENAVNLSKQYRKKINPSEKLPDKDLNFIREGILKRVKSELDLRIVKGYKNIDMEGIRR